MPDRLIITIIILIVGLIMFRLMRAYQNQKARAAILEVENRLPGIPYILYFTLPSCVTCNTVQKPVLQAVHDSLNGQLQIIEVDASVHPEEAKKWGVMTAPTTYVFDANDRLLASNMGLVHKERLLQQLRAGDVPATFEAVS